MDDESSTSFEAALARFLDGEPEPGDSDLIIRSLRESPELFPMVSGMAMIEDLLRQHAEPRPESFSEGLAERLKGNESGSRFVKRLNQRLALDHPSPMSTVRRSVPWFIALAASIAAVIGWHRSLTRPATQNEQPQVVIAPTSRPSDSLALMVNQARAKFADGAAPDAVSFTRGKYALTEGAAHLRFRNGADVVLVAPAKFSIDDAFRMRLDEGALRALVPVSAHGFRILAPGVQFRDLGTEFGVKVQANGPSELHVFDGQVEVYHDGATKPQQIVLGGESVKMVGGVLMPAEGAKEGEFPTANSISLLRWNVWRKDFRVDPNLILYYPFAPDPVDRLLLHDDAERSAHVDGRIQNAEWVTGRWPGKKALQFEHTGDSVALTIPGSFEQITLAAWIKIDHLEDVENTIMSSVGWSEGNLQWQFNRRRSVASTAVFSDPKRRVIWTGATLPVGQWVHWAVTVDRATGQILHYIDGKFACEAAIAPGTTIAPGECLLGRWKDEDAIPDHREFRGRIDELAMWRIALSAKRIAELADAGMPIELPEPVASAVPSATR